MKLRFALLLIFSLSSNHALACRPTQGQLSDKPFEERYKEYINNADAIFVGKILEMSSKDRKNSSFYHYHLIQVSTAYKGRPTRYIEYITPTSCHWVFEESKEYLFFGRTKDNKEYSFGSWEGTSDLNNAIALSVFKLLGSPTHEFKEDLIIQ